MLEYQRAFLNPSSPQGCIPWDSSKQVSEEARVGSLEVQEMLLLSCSLSILKSSISWSLQRRLPLTSVSQTTSSLLVCMRSSRVSPLAGFLSTFVVELSSRRHSRNLQVSALPAGIRVGECPMKTRACECWASSVLGIKPPCNR